MRDQKQIEIAEAQIAKWLKVGVRVDYCAVLGEEPTKRGLTVRSAPYKAASGHWVVFLNGHSGYVSVLSVQPAADVRPDDDTVVDAASQGPNYAAPRIPPGSELADP